MSPRELAEKIVDLFSDESPVPEYVVPKIELILAEALAEAKEQGRNSYGSTVSFERHVPIREVEQAKAAAYEECAEIADQHGAICEDEGCCHRVAEKIRLRAREVK